MLLGNFSVFLALVCMPTISSWGSNLSSCFMANLFIGDKELLLHCFLLKFLFDWKVRFTGMKTGDFG